MAQGVSSVIPAATNVPANEADPKIVVGAADTAFVESRLFSMTRAGVRAFAETKIVLCITADGTTRAAPLLQARAVKNVLA